MSDFDVSEQPGQSVRFQRAAIIFSLTAAGLFLGSAVLQFVASLQRWVVFRSSLGPDGIMAEDHLYDYFFPFESMDPVGTIDAWEPVGTAAQLFGTGLLIQALGILAMAIGVVALPGAASRHSAIRVITAVCEVMLATVVAAAFGIYGAHALISGLAGAPSPLQPWVAIGWLGFAGLGALGALWLSRSREAALACVFLIGSSLAGYLIATYLIAPVVAGYTSHDTTPWTETVVAASTAAAAVAMLLVVRRTARKGVRPV